MLSVPCDIMLVDITGQFPINKKQCHEQFAKKKDKKTNCRTTF